MTSKTSWSVLCHEFHWAVLEVRTAKQTHAT